MNNFNQIKISNQLRNYERKRWEQMISISIIHDN